ncbi:suppressor of SWI4 1 homolog [Echinops telfairi]|uniref:Suppressor of SWI4 1 homolog n=1 Tax=Echinops telfairi TaxID=9371 RepID=A0ABM1VJY4_ECHTE|nr:suppressor of SWI4 1 homolog [Echinops telfairi]
MEPLTATRLQVRKKNSLKDCVAVAGPLGVTHFLIFSKTETNIYFKLIRLPGGPTLTFRINQYTLVRDVVSSLRRHRMHEQQFAHPPLLVLNSFGPHGMHVKLLATMFQNLFPSINVHKVNLNTIKRCLLINFNPDSQELDLRHYSIKVVPVGASRGMKKLLQEKFPNMSRLQDISELLATGAGLSESEAEPDGEHNITELPQAIAGRGNMRAQQSAVRLTEIGPRMTLQLIKIQEGVGEGNVLFHSFVHKTEEELQAMLAAKEERLRLKAQRQDQQAQNVQRKREQREAHKKRSLAGMKRTRTEADGDSDAEDPGAPPEAEGASRLEEEEEDEAEYFRQAVGEEPDADMFPGLTRRRRPARPPSKKQRVKDRKPERGGDRRPPRPKGQLRRGQAKAGPPRAARGRAQGRVRLPKRAARVAVAACLRLDPLLFAEVCNEEGGGGGAQDQPALPAVGRQPCPEPLLVAAEQVLNSIQEGFLWSFLVAEFLVAVTGNGLALYRFSTREQRPWSPAVVFSAQLAISDLLYALTLPPLADYFYPPKHWRFGAVLCYAERFLFTCNLLGSMVFITCISLNRYLGIVHPFFTRSHLRPKHAWAVSAIGWGLAAVLAAPTLSFSRLTTGNCTKGIQVCVKCLGTAVDSQLGAYWVYSLVLAGLGCGLPLLLTLVAYGMLGRAVLRSHGMSRAEKLHVVALVASGVVLYASSYVPYHIMHVLNVRARRRWRAQCPDFVTEAQAIAALDRGLYTAYQIMRVFVPLAICVHPLLYMAAVPSLGCCRPCCQAGQAPKSSSKALPLNDTATSPTSHHPPGLGSSEVTS